MNIKENIAATLNEEMKKRRMSIDKFAKFLEIGKTSLQNYLNKEGNPSLKTLELIAGKLNLSMGELLFRGRKFHSSGRTSLNGIPEEIALLHPRVRESAQLQFLSLQSLYDLSDKLTLEEEVEEILSGEHTA
ncbi:MAG: helix-turn-helix domain-containing protein [Oscillospiraceae bacterium]|nr:helix-turn-helix domain-containing protein [Oscillospiraceae bacterium]